MVLNSRENQKSFFFPPLNDLPPNKIKFDFYPTPLHYIKKRARKSLKSAPKVLFQPHLSLRQVIHTTEAAVGLYFGLITMDYFPDG